MADHTVMFVFSETSRLTVLASALFAQPIKFLHAPKVQSNQIRWRAELDALTIKTGVALDIPLETGRTAFDGTMAVGFLSSWACD